MDSCDQFLQLLRSLPETSEEPHFDKTSFRVKKKIFATYDTKKNQACLKLSLSDQDLLGLQDKSAVYPVPNKWGRKGWTLVELGKVHPDILADAVKSAYMQVATKKLVQQLTKEK